MKPLKSIQFKHIKRQITLDHEWYGNKYGGFNVAPNLIEKKGIIYSFGIGEDISFDRTVIKNHGCDVFAFDPTPKSIKWCLNQELPKTFHFYPFGIAGHSGTTIFNLPSNENHVSGSIINHSNVNSGNQIEVEMKSFVDIQKILNHKKIDLLKMDIEGVEYDVIDDILQSDVEITQIVVEFHERFFTQGKNKSKEFVKSMNRSGYKIFAISDSYEEVSFVCTDAL
jgi:FkbM family methyltransferase